MKNILPREICHMSEQIQLEGMKTGLKHTQEHVVAVRRNHVI